MPNSSSFEWLQGNWELANGLRFATPLWLLALVLIPLVLWLRDRRRVPVLLVPFASSWHRPSLAHASRWPVALSSVGLALLIVALARPQRVDDKREVRSQGYDLMLAIDISGSMLSEDFERNGERMNRLQAVKPVIQAFIQDRPNDRIGMVIFGGRAYTMAPLTFDHDWLSRQTERLKIGMIEDGTAIGDGLGVALSRLEQSGRVDGGQRQGAFVILMTDGANNRGSLAPLQAAEIAKSRNIPVYTIGAGRDGYVPFPVMDENGRRVGTQARLSDLDEGTLREIANQTGGKYFRADNSRTIESAFAAIDRARKIEFQAKSYLVTTELFFWLAIPGATLCTLSALASWRRGAKPASPASERRPQPPATATRPAAPPPLPVTS